jgi:hypothetical protein
MDQVAEVVESEVVELSLAELAQVGGVQTLVCWMKEVQTGRQRPFFCINDLREEARSEKRTLRGLFANPNREINESPPRSDT